MLDVSWISDSRWYIVRSQWIWSFPWSCHGIVQAELAKEVNTGKLLVMVCCTAGFGEVHPVRLSLHHLCRRNVERTQHQNGGGKLTDHPQICRLSTMFRARLAPRPLYQCLRTADPQMRCTVSHLPNSLRNVPQHYSHEALNRSISSRSVPADEQFRRHRLFPRARRRISTSAVKMHEHLTPPKPGEE